MLVVNSIYRGSPQFQMPSKPSDTNTLGRIETPSFLAIWGCFFVFTNLSQRIVDLFEFREDFWRPLFLTSDQLVWSSAVNENGLEFLGG